MNTKAAWLNGDPSHGHQAKIGKTLADSSPWWPPRVQAPTGAPNIVVILLDDLGFSDLGCYGSEIKTPHMDALAAGGLQFTGYTTVPMCTPARAALLTGKNPHAVGCGWLTHANPGYPGYQAGEISPDAPTMAELLRSQGYATYGVGKWHNTPDTQMLPGADQASWPLQRGFDHFYGFLGAEINAFSPGPLIEGNELVQLDAYPDHYYSTHDWTERAIRSLRYHAAGGVERPFFLYLAHNAPHVPLQAPAERVAAYQGVYDAGWDVLRARRYERQQQMGLIPRHWRLPQSNPGVPRWSDVSSEDRPVMAHYMQLFAAMVSLVDDSVGQVVAELKAQGLFDNTLIILTSDNGASSIGGAEGAANVLEKRITQTEPAGLARQMLNSGALGGIDSYAAYPVGWGSCSNTPFRFYKRTPMNGGIRVPLIMSYPKAIADPGARRDQWVHVTDTLPTVLDWLGAVYPDQFKGYATRALDGISYLDVVRDPAHPSRRQAQHFELEGNRAFIRWPWKIVSLQGTGQAIDLDRWLLFNLADDPTECDDRAAQQPQVLEALLAEFEADALLNHLYPLDNRPLKRALTMPPFMDRSFNAPRVFRPGIPTLPAYAVAPLIADRNYLLECLFDWNGQDEGVLFAFGDSTGGMAAYVVAAQLDFVFVHGMGQQRRVRLPLHPGSLSFELQHQALGQRQGQAVLTIKGRSEVEPQAIDMSPTFMRLPGEGLDLGLDRRRKVCNDHADRGVFAYPGLIHLLRVTPGLQAPDSFCNRAEALSQFD